MLTWAGLLYWMSLGSWWRVAKLLGVTGLQGVEIEVDLSDYSSGLSTSSTTPESSATQSNQQTVDVADNAISGMQHNQQIVADNMMSRTESNQ